MRFGNTRWTPTRNETASYWSTTPVTFDSSNTSPIASSSDCTKTDMLAVMTSESDETSDGANGFLIDALMLKRPGVWKLCDKATVSQVTFVSGQNFEDVSLETENRFELVSLSNEMSMTGLRGSSSATTKNVRF